jgi:hypothetical protein
MTITLPAQATDMLNGKHHAQLIAYASDAAFWLHGRDDSTALFLLNQVHSYFREMADELGYDVTPRFESAPLTIIEEAAE